MPNLHFPYSEDTEVFTYNPDGEHLKNKYFYLYEKDYDVKKHDFSRFMLGLCIFCKKPSSGLLTINMVSLTGENSD